MRRSAGFKMLQTAADDEKCILKWPPPYSSSMTPYTDPNFHISVRKACQSGSSVPRMAKVIVLGDIAVGKTSLINRYLHKTYSNNYKPTIGVDFDVERYDILGVPFKLQIWDTAGQERFRAIAASYYREADVIILVFDLGSLISLSHCRQWLHEASQCNSRSYHIFLIGTKRDLMSTPTYKIIEERAVAVAEKLKAEYWAVSAKMGDGVDELFARVAALSFNSVMMRELTGKIEQTTVGSNLISLKRVPTNKNIEKKEKRINRWTLCNVVS